MADTLDDGEFWLPPRFLADDDDDDVLTLDDKAVFGFTSSSDISSSPLESESDEEDYLSGLTRQLAHSTLLPHNNKPTKVKALSPQSTLSPVYGGKPANGQTQDLLFAAAGEVTRIMSSNTSLVETNQKYGAVMLGGPPPPQPQSQPTAANIDNRDFVFYRNQQFQALRFEQMRQQQLMRQKAAEAWAAKTNAQRLMEARPLGLEASAWPSLQQAQQQGNKGGNGMRAVFLGGNRQSAGTGFFMPRCAAAPVEPRKKPDYSTVLVPERVAHALNLDLEKMGAQARLNGGGVAVHLAGNGNFGARQRYSGAYQKRRDSRRTQQQQPAVVKNPELELPQEWTY